MLRLVSSFSHYAECRFAYCHYAERRGALPPAFSPADASKGFLFSAVDVEVVVVTVEVASFEIRDASSEVIGDFEKP
jgi:hypothetical protein